MSTAHGTRSRYTNDACRCDECRAAHARYIRRMRLENRDRQPPKYVHGTNNGYLNYMCRCGPCTSANSDSQRARRAKAKAAQ